MKVKKQELIEIIDKLSDCVYGLKYWNYKYNEYSNYLELDKVVNELFDKIDFLYELVDLQDLHEIIGEKKGS